MAHHCKFRAGLIVLLCLGICAVAGPLAAQDKFTSYERDRAKAMLRDVADGVRKHYYDPKYQGVDMDARFRAAEDKINSATTLGAAFTAIAGVLEGLNDSHTFFNPPSRPFRLDYGYRLQMVGENCFITSVRPETDAAGKLKPGDQVLSIEGFAPTRDSLWKMNYYFNRLFPRATMHLVVRSPEGAERQVEIQAKVHQLKRVVDLTTASSDMDIWQLIREQESQDHLLRQRYVEVADALMIWKMPEFDLGDEGVDHMFGKAHKHQTLILDLRGNPGGRVTTLGRMVGNVFDHDVKIADRIGRKELKPQTAKTRGGNAFTGKLIVLVDARSASAAELFARVVQLKHRGMVLGDRSSGSVMESRLYPYKQGADTKVFYSAAITDADLIMADGKSLEHNGVIPDEMLLPSAADVAAGRDPVLARAAAIAGVKLDPAGAGKLFPFEWLPE